MKSICLEVDPSFMAGDLINVKYGCISKTLKSVFIPRNLSDSIEYRVKV